MILFIVYPSIQETLRTSHHHRLRTQKWLHAAEQICTQGAISRTRSLLQDGRGDENRKSAAAKSNTTRQLWKNLPEQLVGNNCHPHLRIREHQNSSRAFVWEFRKGEG